MTDTERSKKTIEIVNAVTKEAHQIAEDSKQGGISQADIAGRIIGLILYTINQQKKL